MTYSQCRPHQWALSSLSLSSLPSSPPSSSDWSPSRSKVGLFTPSTSSRTGAMLCRLSSADSPMAGRANVFTPPISLELLLRPLPLLSTLLPGSWPSGLLSLESCRQARTNLSSTELGGRRAVYCKATLIEKTISQAYELS
ncbi:hypothetical protein EYF80_019381 [Liparis tanakae]|uniref:Uncharacterized protein n=1 Tax=Liparis tanakae TaxID=230148 RepID=A0A4Z2HYG4_9TELE|nr:hypothetical protein EYF80_019381 [Liparis tanakae]